MLLKHSDELPGSPRISLSINTLLPNWVDIGDWWFFLAQKPSPCSSPPKSLSAPQPWLLRCKGSQHCSKSSLSPGSLGQAWLVPNKNCSLLLICLQEYICHRGREKMCSAIAFWYQELTSFFSLGSKPNWVNFVQNKDSYNGNYTREAADEGIILKAKTGLLNHFLKEPYSSERLQGSRKVIKRTAPSYKRWCEQTDDTDLQQIHAFFPYPI